MVVSVSSFLRLGSVAVLEQSVRSPHRAKRNLMDLISDQDQGLRTQKDAMKQDAIVNAIEAMAVIGGSSVTTGDSLSATWRLLWTTEKDSCSS